MKLLVATLLMALALVAAPLAQGSNYSKARLITNAVFPSSTADIMFKILGCETGGKYNSSAENSSGARGYFQILKSHEGTTYSFGRVTITVVASRLFEPWYNVRLAYAMSRGGTDLSPWNASRACWG